MKDVEIPQDMQRVMAMEAEAMREKRARIIKADAELKSIEISRGKGRGLSAISFRDRRTQRLHLSGQRPTVCETRFQTKAFASASQAFHSAVPTSRWCRLLPAKRAQPVHIVPAWNGLFQS
jgi:regulator of protease activity HflC (stomatin/prohibitin superfamily)